MARGSKSGGRDWKPGESGNPRGGPKKDESITGLIRKYLEETESVEVGKGKYRHTVKMTRKAILARSMISVAAKGAVAGQRLVISYVDGLPKVNIGIEGKLIDLGYDLELTAEDEAHYEDLLSQFFIEPGEMREQARRLEEHAPLFDRLKVLRDAGVDIWDDVILERRKLPPSAGDSGGDGNGQE